MHTVPCPAGETHEQRDARHKREMEIRLAGVRLPVLPPSRTPNLLAHADDDHALKFVKHGGGPHEWREPRKGEPYCYPFRTCSYCGSMHPEDFAAAVKAGATFDWADWKYGFPHKVYVQGVPNPAAGILVRMGGVWHQESGATFDHMAPAPATTHANFYSVHLKDVPDDVFAEIAAAVKERTGVEWIRDEKGLGWRCVAPSTPKENP